MAENILEKITQKKRERIEDLKKNISIDSLNELINSNRTFVNFKEKIENNIKDNKLSIIAEIKKASPSAGVLIKNYDPVEIANIYDKNKVSCLSVLTEEDFFLGNLTHISQIKQKINLPILCKDFFVDKFQIPLAKSYGADAILIILAGVSDNIADELYNEALEIIKSERKASTSFLQRKLQIGYNRAARIIDQMEANGEVSKANHVGKREVLK